jgi:hypothetical protein
MHKGRVEAGKAYVWTWADTTGLSGRWLDEDEVKEADLWIMKTYGVLIERKRAVVDGCVVVHHIIAGTRKEFGGGDVALQDVTLLPEGCILKVEVMRWSDV